VISFWNNTAQQEEEQDVAVIGIAHGDYDYMDERYTKIEGSKIISRNQVVIDTRFGLNVGDTLKIRVRGEYYDLVVSGVYLPPPLVKGLGDIGRRIYVDLPLAQTMFEVYGRYTGIIVKISDFKEADRVVEQLEGKLGHRYRILAVKRDLIEQVERNMEGQALDMLMYAVIVFTIAIVLIFNMQYMNMKGRRIEIGILRSLGMNRRQVFQILILEAFFLGFAASLIGTPLGVFLAEVMGEVYVSPAARWILSKPETVSSVEYTKIYLSENYIYAGILIGPLVTLAATLIPSVIGSQGTIIEAVRGGASRTEERWLPIIAGVLGLALLWTAEVALKPTTAGDMGAMMTFPAYILGGVGLAIAFLKLYAVIWRYLSQPILRRLSSITSRDIGRNMTRAAVTLTLVCMAFTWFVLAAAQLQTLDVSLEKNMERLFPADIILFSDEKIPADLHKKIKNVGGGEYVKYAASAITFETRMKLSGGRIGNYSAPMMGIDVRYFPKVIDLKLSQGTPLGVYYELMQPNTILLSRPVANSLGNLTRGSKVQVLSTERVEYAGQIFYVPTWRRFTVIGVVESNPSSIFAFGAPSLGDPCYVSYSTLTDQFGHIGDYASSFFIEVKDDYKNQLSLVKEAIKRRLGTKYRIGIMTREDILLEIQEEVQREIILFELLEVAGFLVCVLGIAMITTMNVNDRSREIAILRSMGCSRWQLMVMILIEVIALTILGLIVSIPIADRIHRMTVEWVSLYGFEMVYSFTLDPIPVAAFFGLLMGILGSLYPAYRAIRLNIIETLKVEG
ncbi:MAG: ABC transporter permease, partial [Candidatus Bathyarchaeota archaeon]